MKGVIIGGGFPPDKELFAQEISSADIVICADSVVQVMYENGVEPDILVGDFDSIDKQILNHYKINNTNIKVYPPEKDYTDSEIALNTMMNIQGINEISFLGCTGTRLDHVIGNLGMLYKTMNKGIRSYLIDNNNMIMLLDKSCSIDKKYGNYVSFQAFRSDVKNFAIHGAKYDIDGYNLKFGDPRTVSNEFVKDNISVSFDSGIVIVIYSRD